MFARGFLCHIQTVSSGPGLPVSACLWMTYPASTRRNQLHSVSFVVVCCIPGVCFDLSCPRLGRVSDFVSLEFSTYFECSRVLVWLRAKHTCTCDGFFLTAAVLVACSHSSGVVFFFVRRVDISPDVVCPQD